MAKQTRLQYLTDRLKRQEEWIEQCGGDLAGYIARYGDPNVPAEDGKPMYGDGGTLIYEADQIALRNIQRDFDKAKKW
jgi:hypothetical protein